MLRFEPCGASLALPGLTPQVPVPCGIPCHSASWSLSYPSLACPCVLCEPQTHIAAVSPETGHDSCHPWLPLGLLVDPATVTNPPLFRPCGIVPIAEGKQNLRSKGTKGWPLCAKKSQVLWELCEIESSSLFHSSRQLWFSRLRISPTQDSLLGAWHRFSVGLSFEKEELW